MILGIRKKQVVAYTGPYTDRRQMKTTKEIRSWLWWVATVSAIMSAVWLHRFQVQPTHIDSLVVVIRLDRWTGEVEYVAALDPAKPVLQKQLWSPVFGPQ